MIYYLLIKLKIQVNKIIPYQPTSIVSGIVVVFITHDKYLSLG